MCARNHVISARENIGLLRLGEELEVDEEEGLEEDRDEFGEGFELEELEELEVFEVFEEFDVLVADGSKSGSINLLK
jgi:hypothetical protein